MPQTSPSFDAYLNLIPDHRADAIEWIGKMANEELVDLCDWLCWGMADDHGIKLDPEQTAADLRIYIEGHLQQMYDESVCRCLCEPRRSGKPDRHHESAHIRRNRARHHRGHLQLG